VINIEEKIPVRNVLKSGSLSLLERSGTVKAFNVIALIFRFTVLIGYEFWSCNGGG
jgi:hypothetical protein